MTLGFLTQFPWKVKKISNCKICFSKLELQKILKYAKETKGTMNTTYGMLLVTTSKNDLKYSHRCFCNKN